MPGSTSDFFVTRDDASLLPEFPRGLHLLRDWQSGADQQLRELMDATLTGSLDHCFRQPPPMDRIHVCGPVDLLTLTILFRLYGITAEKFYKGDAMRFIRASLMVQRLMGMSKQYISWPVYGFTAEALGQAMIYSDQYSPGTDPDQLLFNQENWREVKTPDFDDGIPRLLDDYVDCFHRLSGQAPVLHLSAPYSIAADTFGQEAIINALTHDPGFVNAFLDLLADRVLEPWIDRFFARYPAGWVELSDASGSPFFIGPQNCRDMAIRASRRLKSKNLWGDRVYDANYRGDYVTCAGRSVRTRPGRRNRRPGNSATMSLQDLFEAKDSLCPDYVIRLAEDRVPVDFYEARAIETRKPLFLGVGATQIDRNSIADAEIWRRQTDAFSRDYVDALKRVAETIAGNGYENRSPPWPGNVYFEDISAESSFELIEIIVANVHRQGRLARSRITEAHKHLASA